MACFGAPARDTWASRGQHHEHPARAQRPIKRRQAQVDVFNNWEGYCTGRVPARAMMLMMLTGRPQRWVGPSGTGRARARLLIMLARTGRAGGGCVRVSVWLVHAAPGPASQKQPLQHSPDELHATCAGCHKCRKDGHGGEPRALVTQEKGGDLSESTLQAGQWVTSADEVEAASAVNATATKCFWCIGGYMCLCVCGQQRRRT